MRRDAGASTIDNVAARSRTASILVSLSIAGAALAGCGGSSKPSYCSSVSNLKSSIKAVPSTNIVQNGIGALQAAVSKVQSDAQTAVSAAKADFPSETTAVTTSVNTLSATVKKLATSPSATAIAQLPGQVSAVVTSVNNFSDATSSKCS
jgi:hypothetical protein